MTKATFWNDGLTVKRELTPQGIVSIPPAPRGKRGTVRDTKAPGLVLRVTDKGVKTFAHLYYAESSNRKAEKKLHLLGDAKVLPLADARKKSRAVATDLDGGKDPNVEKRKAELARGDGVAALLEKHYKWISERKRNEHVPKDIRDFRKYVEPVFGAKRIGDISTADVTQFVEGLAATPYQAKNVFQLFKRFLNRTAALGYIKQSPAAALRFSDIVGEGLTPPREYEATDADIKAFWFATFEVGEPWGAAWRLLLLTGARVQMIGGKKDSVELNGKKIGGEHYGLTRDEIDRKAKLITLGKDRTKSKRVHKIPLTDTALEIIDSLPLWNGPFVFSASGGLRPLNGWSNAKERLDEAMDKKRGSIRTHDTRRIVEQKLAELRGTIGDEIDIVSELILDHALPGLKRVYGNPNAYLQQKREALEKWEAELLRIIGPEGRAKHKAATKVTPLRKAA